MSIPQMSYLALITEFIIKKSAKKVHKALELWSSGALSQLVPFKDIWRRAQILGKVLLRNLAADNAAVQETAAGDQCNQ